MKKPITAAILNIYPGLGYLYLDATQLIAWLIYYVFTFAAISMASAIKSAGDSTSSTYSAGFWVWLASLVVLWIMLIIDAYRTANRMQESIRPTNEQSIALTGIWAVSRSYARQDTNTYQPVQLFIPQTTAAS